MHNEIYKNSNLHNIFIHYIFQAVSLVVKAFKRKSVGQKLNRPELELENMVDRYKKVSKNIMRELGTFTWNIFA